MDQHQHHHHQHHHHHTHQHHRHHINKSNRVKKSGTVGIDGGNGASSATFANGGGNGNAGGSGNIFQTVRERKPNIILILTDDQDVELGMCWHEFGGSTILLYGYHTTPVRFVGCKQMCNWIKCRNFRFIKFYAAHTTIDTRCWCRISACVHHNTDVLSIEIVIVDRCVRTQSHGVHKQWQLFQSPMASDTWNEIICHIFIECWLSNRLVGTIQHRHSDWINIFILRPQIIKCAQSCMIHERFSNPLHP